MARILVDFTQPEGDQYEWYLSIIETDIPPCDVYTGPNGIKCGSWWEHKAPLLQETLLMYKVSPKYNTLCHLWNALTHDERKNILRYVNEEGPQSIEEYSRFLWAVMTTIMQQAQCDYLWHVAE